MKCCVEVVGCRYCIIVTASHRWLAIYAKHAPCTDSRNFFPYQHDWCTERFKNNSASVFVVGVVVLRNAYIDWSKKKTKQIFRTIRDGCIWKRDSHTLHLLQTPKYIYRYSIYLLLCNPIPHTRLFQLVTKENILSLFCFYHIHFVIRIFLFCAFTVHWEMCLTWKFTTTI